MTGEEAQALKPGDTVYVSNNWTHSCNALSGSREFKTWAETVVKVNAKTVKTKVGAYAFSAIMSDAEGAAAIAAFDARKSATAAIEARRVAAVEGVKRLGLNTSAYGGLTVSASGIDDIERLAELLIIAARARDAQNAIMCQIADAPCVMLTLSVVQAERVIAALGGAA